MKITKRDRELIKELEVIGTNIYDIFTYISSEGTSDELQELLMMFLEREKQVYLDLELTNEKCRLLSDYINYEYCLGTTKEIPTLLNTGINIQNYPFYRIYAKCNYSLMEEYISLNAGDLDNVRREITDMEVTLIYNLLLKKSDKHKDNMEAIKLKLMAYLCLVDSPSVEKYFVEQGLTGTEYITSEYKDAVDQILEREKTVASVAHKKQYYIDYENRNNVYSDITIKRLNEIISSLLYYIGIVVRFFDKSYLKDSSFIFHLSYLEVSLSMCNEKIRKDIYKTLNDQIEECDDIEIKLKYKKLLNDAIGEIETELVPRIVRVSIIK